MNHAFPRASIVAVRREPSERSEMVTQLLFGESCRVAEVIGRWARVILAPDDYEGWIPVSSLYFLDHDPGNDPSLPRLSRIMNAVDKDTGSRWILPQGGIIRQVDPGTGLMEYAGCSLHITMKDVVQVPPSREAIVSLARTFLHAPYLWGGKTVFGIDCSGLVQVVFSIAGIVLPRDAGKQVNEGTTVPFIQEALPGDLAFFGTNGAEISHVGILLSAGKIIHASAFVREDLADSEGIFSSPAAAYTHRLRVIKRVIG